MIHKILTTLLLVISSVLFSLNSATAQDMATDSAFSILNQGKKFIDKIVLERKVLVFEEIDKDNKDIDGGNSDGYGIGNVIGKKKGEKSNKKAGKAIKVKLNLTATKVLEYEIKLDKGNFSIERKITSD